MYREVNGVCKSCVWEEGGEGWKQLGWKWEGRGKVTILWGRERMAQTEPEQQAEEAAVTNGMICLDTSAWGVSAAGSSHFRSPLELCLPSFLRVRLSTLLLWAQGLGILSSLLDCEFLFPIKSARCLGFSSTCSYMPRSQPGPGKWRSRVWLRKGRMQMKTRVVAFKGILTILLCIALIVLKEWILGLSGLPFPRFTGGSTHVLRSSSPDLHLSLTVRETEARRAWSNLSHFTGQQWVEHSRKLSWSDAMS